ncbi:MAG: fibronectin type III domain-containing protein, partial [Actinomycetota bacterium]
AIQLQGADDTRSLSTSASPLVIDALVNGSTYRARIASVNSAGAGEWSAWTSGLTPRGPAAAPVGLTATAGDASAALTWTAPPSDGGSAITGYVVEVSTRGVAQQLTTTDARTTLVGLTNGVTYSVRVAASTDFGPGQWSTPLSITPRAARVTEPTGVSASRAGRKVTVTWSAPAIGKPARYAVLVSIDGKPARVASTTPLTRATIAVRSGVSSVQVRVAAIDSYGRGPLSSPVTVRFAR